MNSTYMYECTRYSACPASRIFLPSPASHRLSPDERRKKSYVHMCKSANAPLGMKRRNELLGRGIRQSTKINTIGSAGFCCCGSGRASMKIMISIKNSSILVPILSSPPRSSSYPMIRRLLRLGSIYSISLPCFYLKIISQHRRYEAQRRRMDGRR